jgi:chemotaxis protein CheX
MEGKDITPFVKSVGNVFSTMLQVHVTHEAPRLKEPASPCYDVSGIIGLSEDITGAVVLSFPADTAVRIVELLTGEKFDLDHPDFADAIGELVNMVTGGAKAEFVDRHVSISCPSMIVGPGHRVFQQKNSPIIEIPCDCECGSFSVFVSMRDVKGEQSESAASAAAVS